MSDGRTDVPNVATLKSNVLKYLTKKWILSKCYHVLNCPPIQYSLFFMGVTAHSFESAHHRISWWSHLGHLHWYSEFIMLLSCYNHTESKFIFFKRPYNDTKQTNKKQKKIISITRNKFDEFLLNQFFLKNLISRLYTSSTWGRLFYFFALFLIFFKWFMFLLNYMPYMWGDCECK